MTTLKFSLDSFILGAGRAFDLGATRSTTIYHVPNKISDAEAILSDWAIVGEDIKTSIEKFEKEQSKKKE